MKHRPRPPEQDDQGAVARVFDYDEIRLVDASGDIVVYLGPEAPTIAVGEQLMIRGRIDDDLISCFAEYDGVTP